MPSRREYDVPASGLAAALGVLVIVASAPFTVQAYFEVTDTGKEYAVAWAQGKDAAGALKAVVGQLRARSIVYKIDVSFSRPASTVPLVGPAAPTLNAQLELSATTWTPSVTLAQEASK